MKLYLIRHGQMAGDAFARPVSPVSGALSPEGVAQAESLARAFASVSIDVVFASPYGRAVQTAELAFASRRIPIVRVEGLREWTPSDAARSATGTEFETMQKRDDDRYAEETWKTELGEGTFDLYARVVPAFLDAAASIGWHNRMGGWVCSPGAESKSAAVVAHGGSLGVLASFLLGVRPFPIAPFSFAHAGVAEIGFTPRRGIYHPALVFPAPAAAKKKQPPKASQHL